MCNNGRVNRNGPMSYLLNSGPDGRETISYTLAQAIATAADMLVAFLDEYGFADAWQEIPVDAGEFITFIRKNTN